MSTGMRGEIIPFTGGLNEQVSNLEVTSGELIYCQNYVERDDIYSGYESVSGYERFDGQTPPSMVQGDENDDTAREAQRALISAPTGTGECRGIFIWNDEIHTLRDEDTTPKTYKAVFKETLSGWSEVSAFDHKFNDGGKLRSVTGIFTNYNSGNEVIILVDGVSDTVIYNGTTATSISEPDTNIGKPTHCCIFKNRLVLVFPGGNIVFSAVGDPTNFDTVTANAGRVRVGEEVTNIQETKGGILVITSLTGIKLMYYGGTSDDETFVFKLDTFSESVGAYEDTIKPMVGTSILANQSGVTTLTAVDAYGDFRESILSKKVQRSYTGGTILASVTDKQKGRYYTVHANGAGTTYMLCFSMRGAKLKSVTRIVYPLDITYITNIVDSDGIEYIYFGDGSGMVYKAFSGTSFDGADIFCSMHTAFYSYKSPRIWKRFTRLFFEMQAQGNFQILVLPRYNYGSSELPSTTNSLAQTYVDPIPLTVVGSGYYWDDPSTLWGTAVWGNGETDSLTAYISGYGSNMGVEIRTLSKYNAPHALFNMQVSYTTNTQQL